MRYSILSETSVYIGRVKPFSQTRYMEVFFPITGMVPEPEAKPTFYTVYGLARLPDDLLDTP